MLWAIHESIKKKKNSYPDIQANNSDETNITPPSTVKPVNSNPAK
jgi:hypothetical protein